MLFGLFSLFLYQLFENIGPFYKLNLYLCRSELVSACIKQELLTAHDGYDVL